MQMWAQATPQPSGEGEGEVIEMSGEAPSMAAVLEQSAEAVDVVETEEAQRESADMGEVLARSEGVGVRRGGGLGADEHISLAGLSGEQVRLFVDGVPIELTGFALGIGNVPVNLVERVEIYRGVVPLRFGADALGGAFNLVTDGDQPGTNGSASYQVGSFGTHRATLGGRYEDDASGLFVRVNGFGDYTRNDYAVDVEVADERGRVESAQVDRFHDGYRATGGGVEFGVVDKPWAERLQVQGFYTDYNKDLQHNLVMTVPYGEVTYGETGTGGSARYVQDLGPSVRLDAVAGYAYRRIEFRDVGEWVYDWHGERIRERAQAGEIESRPHHQLHWQHGALARIGLVWDVAAQHRLRFAAAPTATTRTGDERRQTDPSARDPLTAQRDLLTLVTGAEYELSALDRRLENVAFAKDYVYAARTEEPVPGGSFRRRDRDVHRLGVGDAVRYRVADWLDIKASYEWATRLPSPSEVFGNGMLIVANLELRPETSHNPNLGAIVRADTARAGTFRGEVNLFGRFADQLIVLLSNDRVFSYQNVFEARSLGVDAAATWTAPGNYLALNANATWQDFVNTSAQGTFGDFEGDRIPNQPYLFANASTRATLPEPFGTGDELSLTWHARYVHTFFRGWESAGLREFKQTVPSQLLHSAALTYVVRHDVGAMTVTMEIHNLTDERAYDFFGVQRPGRALYFKTTAEF